MPPSLVHTNPLMGSLDSTTDVNGEEGSAEAGRMAMVVVVLLTMLTRLRASAERRKLA